MGKVTGDTSGSRVRATDLVGDCPFLNRRLDLIDSQVATAQSTASSAAAAVSAAVPAANQTMAAPGQAGVKAQVAYATAVLLLAPGLTDIPGATITLARSGTYIIIGAFNLQSVNDATILLTGKLVADGVVQSQPATLSINATGAMANVSQVWIYSPTVVGKVVKLQAMKSGGTGTSAANGLSTSITAIWISD